MGIRKLAEDLNLKTGHQLKGLNIKRLSDHELIACVSVCRTGMASSATGIGIHGLLTCAGWAPSMVAAGLNAVQFAVATANRERIDEEIANRCISNPDFKNLLGKTDDALLHIVVGSSVKGITTAMTLGVAGVLSAGDLISNAIIGPHVPCELTASESAQFITNHEEGAAADKIFKTMVGPIGELAAQQLTDATQLPITEKTTWAELQAMNLRGVSMENLVAQTAAVGLANEANPLPLIVEHAVNEKVHNSTQRKALEQEGKGIGTVGLFGRN